MTTSQLLSKLFLLNLENTILLTVSLQLLERSETVRVMRETARQTEREGERERGGKQDRVRDRVRKR